MRRPALSQKENKNLIGQTFGNLTVLEDSGERTSQGRIIWKCKCSCSNNEIITSDTSTLKQGNKLSCGCTKRAKLSTSDGDSLKNSPFHKLYNFHSERKYMGHLCDVWRNDYLSMKRWMIANGWQPGKFIMRKDPQKIYCPNNTVIRDTLGKKYTYKGKSKTLTQWIEALDIDLDSTTIRKRLGKGWTVEEALETPKFKNRDGTLSTNHPDYKWPERKWFDEDGRQIIHKKKGKRPRKNSK